LLERLLATTGNFGTSLGALGTSTSVRKLRRHDLVHHRNVGLTTEIGIAQGDGSDFFASLILDL
jgi:hypothetical protein